MRIFFDVYEDEACWTEGHKFNHTFELIETTKDMFGTTIFHMCADVEKPTDLVIENLCCGQLSKPTKWEPQGDNTFLITEVEPIGEEDYED